VKPMQKPTFDPGLTQQFTGSFRRVIGRDGSFNVIRRGGTGTIFTSTCAWST